MTKNLFTPISYVPPPKLGQVKNSAVTTDDYLNILRAILVEKLAYENHCIRLNNFWRV